MNITLTADEALIKQAREFARSRGTSLNSLIREQMRRMTSGDSEAAAAEFLEFRPTDRNRTPHAEELYPGHASPPGTVQIPWNVQVSRSPSASAASPRRWQGRPGRSW